MRGNLSANTTVNVNILSKQADFKIMMNYELGMHCTGFEFAYCCVLPPYNSILAQVVKPQASGDPVTAADFPRLLEDLCRPGGQQPQPLVWRLTRSVFGHQPAHQGHAEAARAWSSSFDLVLSCLTGVLCQPVAAVRLL